jgi:protease-4
VRAASADEKKADQGKAKIPVFRLHGEITESPAEEGFPFGSARKHSFRELVSRLKKAADDSSVKAIVLLADGESLGSAQIEELRQTMAQVRKAGKDIYVHSDSFSMREYLLFAGATRISAVPTADLWVTGLHGEAPYLRGLLDKIGVKPEILTCGSYKSAGEIFMRTGPSPEADQMQNWLLDSLYDTYVRLIAQGRGVDAAKVKEWIDNGPYTAAKAKEAGMIDAVEGRQDFTAMLKSKYGQDVVFAKKYGDKKQPDMDLSSPFAFLKIWGDLLNEGKKKKSGKDAVAIVYVEGAISLGGADPSPFGGDTGATSFKIRKALDDVARDDSVKAVVLRVDSPGGSAVASDIILDATKRVKAKKPFVVSMGNVAGSGGYYVACGADTIFADDATITGSIGVVAGKMVTTGMWNKLGVNFKEYKRGRNAGILGSAEPFSPEERERMQSWMNDIYGVFKKHVTDVRGNRLKKPIDELAGGRVYTGKQALELGLVDKIGSLQDAIHYIADQAKIKDYDIRAVPEPKNFIEQLIEETSGGKEDTHNVDVAAPAHGADRPFSLVDLALPYLKDLDPARVQSIKHALGRLQLINQEGAVLMMPEFRVRD